MKPKTKAIAILLGLLGILLIILAALAISGPITNSIPGIEKKYDLTCKTSIKNNPLSAPYIDTVECYTSSSGLFSITDIFYDSGNLKMMVQGKAVFTQYKVPELGTTGISIFCPPICFDEGVTTAKTTVRGLMPGEEEVTIQLFNEASDIIDQKKIWVAIP